MANRHSAALSVAALAIAGILPVVGAEPAAAVTTVACDSITLDNPHVSVGAGGVISKARAAGCGPTARLNYYMTLRLCPANANPPNPITKSWVTNNCAFKASAVYPQSGTGYFNPSNPDTKYVPRSGQSGAQGRGLWIAYLLWDTMYTNVNGDTRYEQGEIFKASRGVIG